MIKMIRCIAWYRCAVCGTKYETYEEAINCAENHAPDREEFVCCNVCGAGWNTNAFGRAKATKLAKECLERHKRNGETKELARKTFFQTKGTFGFTETEAEE